MKRIKRGVQSTSRDNILYTLHVYEKSVQRNEVPKLKVQVLQVPNGGLFDVIMHLVYLAESFGQYFDPRIRMLISVEE